jgi:hypothetical protein
MRLRLLILLAAICTISTNAQDEVESKQIKIVEQSPGAPNTASLGKYFEVPVNMSTGVPSIQIPLYVIKTGSISIPITLSYHSAGNKVNNPASWVGFGWDLSCGGVISKQVNGLDDFCSMTQYPNPYNGGIPAWSTYMNPDYTEGGVNLGINSITQVIDTMGSAFGTLPGSTDLIYRLVGRIIKNRYDGEADEYNFNTPDGSGSIFYNQRTTEFVANEINGWKVSFDSFNNTWFIQKKDGKGFYFAAREDALSPYYSAPSFPFNPQEYFTSAWYLSGIYDPVNGRGVSFDYDYSPFWGLSNLRVYTENWNTSYHPASYVGGSPRDILRYGNQLNVKFINFPEGMVEFVKDTTGRLDGGISALRYIRVYDKNNILKKQFELKYFYAWSGIANSARLFLKSIQEMNYISGLASDSRPYIINYDTTAAMPPRFSYAQDIWGYNNGKTANTTNIPTLHELTWLGIPPHANRYVDTNYTRSGIIKQIVYPTGGNLNFTFDFNRDGNDSLVGGLRIKRIVNYDSLASKSLITEYRYDDDNGHSTGLVASRPGFHYYYDNGTNGTAPCRISGDPIYPLFGNQGSPVTYTRVEKVEIGDSQELKTLHYFYSDLSGFNISPEAVYRNANIGVPFNKMSDLQRFSYHPYSTEIYKKLPNGQYKIIKKELQGYDVLNGFKKYIWNIQAAWGQAGWDAWIEWAGWDPYNLTPLEQIPYMNGYKSFQDNIVNTGSTTETTDDNDHVISQKIYREFDTLNGNLRKIATISSNGDTLRTYLKYAANYESASSSDPVNEQINYLIANNILAAPIEIVKTLQAPGSTEVLMDADLYFYENGKLRKNLKITEDIPFSGFTQSYNNATSFYYDTRYKLESEIELFNASKNPVQIKLKDKVQSLIWDGDDILATVINANSGNIAYSSFETTEKGNWNYSGSVVVDNTVPTGYKGYNLATGSITNSVIDGSKPYVISYWSNNGSKTVNSTSGIPGRTVNGWTYYEHNIASTGGQVSVSGTGLIDELRLYPKGALMSSFSYIPLIGLKNQCDPNNSISYYEYDGMGRLVILRDQDKNVLKKICYNYAGQPENCTYNCIDTTSVWQNTSTALRCQQGSNGNTGYQEQEQKNINPCSPTYNQLRWVVTGQNTTACPLSTNISISYTNTAGLTGFTAVYYNSRTGQSFSFPVPVGSGVLGSVPPAKYTVTISKSGNNIILLFGCGCFSTTGTFASFSNVNVSNLTCKSITIENGN